LSCEFKQQEFHAEGLLHEKNGKTITNEPYYWTKSGHLFIAVADLYKKDQEMEYLWIEVDFQQLMHYGLGTIEQRNQLRHAMFLKQFNKPLCTFNEFVCTIFVEKEPIKPAVVAVKPIKEQTSTTNYGCATHHDVYCQTCYGSN
jgi:hypothetical protein